MGDQLTDIELSLELSIDISDDYQIALEFIKSNPDYSLHKFRAVVEGVIYLVAKNFDIKLEGKRIIDNIHYLLECQVIHKCLSDNLHTVRKLGNSGVHKGSNFKGEAEAAFYRESKDRLIEGALTARKTLVSIFEDVYFLTKKTRPSLPINLVSIGHQEYRETIYNASVSTCFKEKLKAGIICESILDEQNYAAPIVISNEFKYHLEGLERNALAFYEASYKISAQVGDKLSDLSSNTNEEAIILKNCELEPLYKYAALALSPNNDEGVNKLGMLTLRKAADRGYAPAEALMGTTLYNEKKFKIASKYLLSAENKDEYLALQALFYFYTDGTACKPNPDMALKYLQRAVDLGCPDALAILGEVHHKGKHLPKNDLKAKELLDESVSRGSARGKRYLLVEFNDLAGKVIDQFEQIAREVEKISDAKKPKPFIRDGKKVKPNEPCPCGSGSKYKRCCRQ
jgi:hypothetical protein